MAQFDQPITEHVWKKKYRHDAEPNPKSTHARVISGVYALDDGYDTAAVQSFMDDFGWVPGGRIYAGAGTDKRVTLLNCFVNQRVGDSMEGIMGSLNVAAVTQQQGGGIGTGFSSIRPAGAVVKRTGTVSTGVLPFMDMWNAMCATVKSSGSRRGAMMATLACWHPDLPAFITAKQQEGRLTNFNVSVLATDDFMRAVLQGEQWDLGFHVPPADGSSIIAAYPSGDPNNFTSSRWWREMFPGYEECTWYVYKRVNAAELFEDIVRSTYEYAEPGVIFIDQVNHLNNLNYCEYIDCTNPCGEQPLPPDDSCDLGHVNLATCVLDAFTVRARIDWDRVQACVTEGVRFLDNVRDITLYPTAAQGVASKSTRRIGLGLLGLGNMFQMMMVRYGSKASVQLAEDVMSLIRDTAYRASIELSKERGPFPSFISSKYLESPFVASLPQDVRDGISEHGIRNGVLLTLAPTGTTSMYVGNVSSGCEPSFSWFFWRKMLRDERDEQSRDVYDEFFVEDYGFREYLRVCVPESQWQSVRDKIKAGEKTLPDYMVTALELTVDDHLSVQHALQKYVDASISKTINCPADMAYDDFKEVYVRAWRMGLKGVTTYRPSGVRGAVLSTTQQFVAKATRPEEFLATRPDNLPSVTYKRRWMSLGDAPTAYYVTITDFIEQGGARRPFEIFVTSMNVAHFEWMVAFTRTVSSIFRRNRDIGFIIAELKQVHSPAGGMFISGKYVHSLVAMIAGVIEEHVAGYTTTATGAAPILHAASATYGEMCPACLAPALIFMEGCRKCQACGYSTCG